MRTASHTTATATARSVGWFDHPLLSLLLGVSWLALSHSLALVHVLSAVLIGAIAPRVFPILLERGAAAAQKRGKQ